MKVIITESQLNDMVPLSMRRKVSLINTWIDTLFNTEDYKPAMERQAKSITLDEFMNYIINFIESLIVMNITDNNFMSHRDFIRFIIRDRVDEFWKKVNGVK